MVAAVAAAAAAAAVVRRLRARSWSSTVFLLSPKMHPMLPKLWNPQF